MKISIYRYIPDQDEEPWMQDYTFDLAFGQDMMVLDLLEQLRETDPTLAYRRSCREGVCGSDGMNINGMNGLACITPVSEVLNGGTLPSGQRIYPNRGAADIVLRPLPGLPVIRDLVVDMSLFGLSTNASNPTLSITSQHPPSNVCNLPRIAPNLMGSTSAFCVHVAPRPALHGGGTLNDTLGQLDY